MPSNRNQVAIRLVWVIRRLDGLKYMPESPVLAAELGVSQRTIWRYLEALELAGWTLPKRWYPKRAA